MSTEFTNEEGTLYLSIIFRLIGAGIEVTDADREELTKNIIAQRKPKPEGTPWNLEDITLDDLDMRELPF